MRFLKFIFLLLLLYYLYHLELFNWETIQSLFTWKVMVLTGTLVFVNLLLNSFRWFLLVRSQGFGHSFKKIFSLNMLGVFFNFALPSSVGGDAVKVYKIVGPLEEDKVKAGLTVIMDRMIGLYSMMLIACVCSFIYFQKGAHEPVLEKFLISIIVLFVGLNLFFILISLDKVDQQLKRVFKKIPKLGPLFLELLSAFHLYRKSFKVIVMGIALTVLAQTFAFGVFYVVSLEVREVYKVSELLLAVPLGFMASIVPLSPGGVGVGQFAFKYLLTLLSGLPGVTGVMGISLIQFWQFVVGGLVSLVSFISDRPH